MVTTPATTLLAPLVITVPIDVILLRIGFWGQETAIEASAANATFLIGCLGNWDNAGPASAALVRVATPDPVRYRIVATVAFPVALIFDQFDTFVTVWRSRIMFELK